MKKPLGKMLALLLTVIMVLGSTIAVFAANDKVTITITPPNGTTDTGETYQAFKIFDVVKAAGVNSSNDNEEHKGFAYTIAADSPWLSVVQGLKNSSNVNYFTLTQPTGGTEYTVSLNNGITLSEETAIEIATKLLAAKPAGATSEAINSGSEKAVAPGYYLITSSLGSNLILATTDISIQEKNNFPSVAKSVAENDQVAEIGSDVTFTITATIPASADKQLVLDDTMSTGLTYKTVTSIKNSDNANVTADTVSPSGNKVTFTFSADTIKANAGKTITVVYTATVNKNAKVSALNDSTAGGDTDDNTNTVEIQYSNFKQTAVVDVNTLSFQLNKYDGSETVAAGAEPTPIAGAKFQLLNASKQVVQLYKVNDTTFRLPTAEEVSAGTNIVQDFTTVAGTKLKFDGVDSDLTYYLREIEAPAGYNKVSEDTEVKPATDLSTISTIANNKGSELPSTGGMGTTIIYIVGSLMAVSAAVLLVVRRRMNAR